MNEALNALIVLNQSAMTIEQIAGFVARMRNGDVPTEEEIDQAANRNTRFAESELSRLDDD